MCGIVGYLGNEEKKEILLDGLQELEYRGYDSAGIAIIEGDKLNQFKAIGKLENLREKTSCYDLMSIATFLRRSPSTMYFSRISLVIAATSSSLNS